MKEKIEMIIFCCIVVLFLAGGLIFSAWRDYRWPKKYLEDKNYLVFSVQKNVIDIFHPYSIFKPPIVRLGLIRKESLKKINDEVFYVEVLWVSKEIGKKNVREEEFKYLLDCKNYRTGWNEKGENIENVEEIRKEPEGIKWLVFKEKEGIKSCQKECNIIKEFLNSKQL